MARAYRGIKGEKRNWRKGRCVLKRGARKRRARRWNRKWWASRTWSLAQGYLPRGCRLVRVKARDWCAEVVLHSGESAGRSRGSQLRPTSAPRQKSRARLSMAARILAHRTIAGVIAPPLDMRKRSIRLPAISDSMRRQE